MAVIQCKKCGHKALQRDVKIACPVCDTPYENTKKPEHVSDAENVSPSLLLPQESVEPQRENLAAQEQSSLRDEGSEVDEHDETGEATATHNLTPFQIRIISTLESILSARYWDEVRALIEEHQEALLSIEGYAFIQELSATFHQEEDDATAEHIDMYLNVFADAMEHNNDIESAWQRFQSELQQTMDALKELIIAIARGDIRPLLEEKGNLLLSATTFACFYRGIIRAGGDKTDMGRILHLFLHILYAVREGEIPTPEQLREMLSEIIQKANQQGNKFTMLPGVPGVDRDDPQTALLLQEMINFFKEQPDLFTSFMTEGLRWLDPSASGLEAPQLQDEGIPKMRELVTQILKHASREKYPHLWATLQNMLEGFELSSPEQGQSSSSGFLNYEPPFSYEEAPDQWGQAIALRGIQAYQRSMGEHNQDTEQAIARFTKALSAFTYERNPVEWTTVHNMRAIAYMDRRGGEPTENIREAIADLDAVFAVLEREKYLMSWAMTGYGHCMAYSKLFYLTNERHLLERVISDSEAVLAIFEQLGHSAEWADILCMRGIAYVEYGKGEQQQNIHLALADFESAATFLTHERDPEGWALLQMNMGTAYLYLVSDNRNQYLKQALICLNAALSVFKRETTPVNWARTMMNRGMTYNALMTGDLKQNQENALADFNASLEVFSERRMPIDWAKGHVNRGGLYLERIAGKQRTNYELAVDDCTNALHVLTKERTPVLYAITLVNRGMAYGKLARPEFSEIEQDFLSFDEMFNRFLFTSGPVQFTSTYMHYFNEYQRFSKQALADFDEALTVLTPEGNPREWAHACRVKAMLGSSILGFGSQEEQAARYFDEALSIFKLYNMPLEVATTLNNRAAYYLYLVLNGKRQYVDQVLSDLDASITVFTREIAPGRYRASESIRAQLFAVLQRWKEAHETLLKARAAERDLIISTIDSWTQFDIAAEFAPIDIYLRDAQALLHLKRPQEAVVALEEGRARSLHIALDIDSLDPTKISNPQAKQRAEDFLAALDTWRALQQGAVEQMQKNKDEVVATVTQTYQDLLQVRDAIRQYDNPDFMAPVPTWERITHALSSDDEALVYLATDVQDSDKNGMALIVTKNRAGLAVATPLTLPGLTRNALSDLFEADKKSIPPINIGRALQSLGHLALNEIAEMLLFWKINKVRLIPYGRLGLFPLPSVYVTLSGQKKRPLSETFDEVTIVPSARALEISHKHVETQHTHLLIAGNPQPLSEEWKKQAREKQALLYAEAEAEACSHLARKHGYLPAKIHYLRPEEITKQQVIEELEQAWYAHLATHGNYNVEEPQNSQLILAGKEHIPEQERTISLREALDGSVNLVGLRLLVLSACETSVFDIRRAPNEVVGLAAGFLQAGAAGVIATLWKVSERATYLLMSHFVDLYLDPHLHLSPAEALAQAQHWLREEATNQVLQNYKPDLLAMVVNRLSETHQTLLARLHKDAAEGAKDDPNACMYAAPVHWAAFVVTGC